jgi:hypothetical protein
MVTAFLTGGAVKTAFFISGTLIVSFEENKPAYEAGLKNELKVINPYVNKLK